MKIIDKSSIIIDEINDINENHLKTRGYVDYMNQVRCLGGNPIGIRSLRSDSQSEVKGPKGVLFGRKRRSRR